jgi:hypothetical protein
LFCLTGKKCSLAEFAGANAVSVLPFPAGDVVIWGRVGLKRRRRLKMPSGLFGTALVVLAASVILYAQSAKPPATATAQAVKSAPDLSGVWMSEPYNLNGFSEPSKEPWTEQKIQQYMNAKGLPAAVVPMTSWAAQKFAYNKAPDGGRRNEMDSYIHCAPPGVPRNWLISRPFEIVQDSRRVLILYEGDHWVRQIWTDGRTHPADAGHTWGGHSIGKWDGDALVVDTIGFNDRTFVDMAAHPHSDAMHLTERIRRAGHDHLVIDVTFDDPKAFTKPWTGERIAVLHADWTLEEVIPCEDKLLGHPIPTPYSPLP